MKNITFVSDSQIKERQKQDDLMINAGRGGYLQHTRRIKPFCEFEIEGTFCLPENEVSAKNRAYWGKNTPQFPFKFTQEGKLLIKPKYLARFLGDNAISEGWDSYSTIDSACELLEKSGFINTAIGLLCSQLLLVEETFCKKVLHISEGVGRMTVETDELGYDTFFLYEVKITYLLSIKKAS